MHSVLSVCVLCGGKKTTELLCAGLQPYSTYQLRAACFNNMGSTASNWTTVTTLSEGETKMYQIPHKLTSHENNENTSLSLLSPLSASFQPPSMCLLSQWAAT